MQHNGYYQTCKPLVLNNLIEIRLMLAFNLCVCHNVDNNIKHYNTRSKKMEKTTQQDVINLYLVAKAKLGYHLMKNVEFRESIKKFYTVTVGHNLHCFDREAFDRDGLEWEEYTMDAFDNAIYTGNLRQFNQILENIFDAIKRYSDHLGEWLKKQKYLVE